MAGLPAEAIRLALGCVGAQTARSLNFMKASVMPVLLLRLGVGNAIAPAPTSQKSGHQSNFREHTRLDKAIPSRHIDAGAVPSILERTEIPVIERSMRMPP